MLHRSKFRLTWWLAPLRCGREIRRRNVTVAWNGYVFTAGLDVHQTAAETAVWTDARPPRHGIPLLRRGLSGAFVRTGRKLRRYQRPSLESQMGSGRTAPGGMRRIANVALDASLSIGSTHAAVFAPVASMTVRKVASPSWAGRLNDLDQRSRYARLVPVQEFNESGQRTASSKTSLPILAPAASALVAVVRWIVAEPRRPVRSLNEPAEERHGRCRRFRTAI